MEIVEEADDEEMELGELDLDAIEEKCGKKGKGYVTRWQIELLQEAIIKVGAHLNLGVTLIPLQGISGSLQRRNNIEEGSRTSNALQR